MSVKGENGRHKETSSETTSISQERDDEGLKGVAKCRYWILLEGLRPDDILTGSIGNVEEKISQKWVCFP